MKKLVIISLLIISTVAQSKVIRVNNRTVHGKVVNAPYKTLQAAHNAANNGDTIYLEASPNSYGKCVFSKKLHVIGAGYNANWNDSTQAYKQNTIVNQIKFNKGSQGSVIEGCFITEEIRINNWLIDHIYEDHPWIYSGHYYSYSIFINTDNITIRKNYIYTYSNANANFAGIFIQKGNNVTIQQNYIHSYSLGDTDEPYSTALGIVVAKNHNNNKNNLSMPIIDLTISNNLFRVHRRNMANVRSFFIKMLNRDADNGVVIFNNVFGILGHSLPSEGIIDVGNALLYNNIMITGKYWVNNTNTLINNACNEAQFSGSDNFTHVDMTKVFVTPSTEQDNGYVLQENTPARIKGVNGGEMGIFGYQAGGVPYVLSGMPAIPALFDVSGIFVGKAAASVNVKAKSHSLTK